VKGSKSLYEWGLYSTAACSSFASASSFSQIARQPGGQQDIETPHLVLKVRRVSKQERRPVLLPAV